MKLFKTVDERFAEIGFTKVSEDEHGATYHRVDKEYGYTQCLDLMRKASGRHIVQSYDTNLMDEKRIGNTCVGLTLYEMKLCVKKMKQLGWKAVK